MLENQFDGYKGEFSSPKTTDERKVELISLMRTNLKERSKQNSGFVDCLDGQKHSLDSNEVTDLYAIDGALKYKQKAEQRELLSEKIRNTQLERNLYDKDNPYPRE